MKAGFQRLPLLEDGHEHVDRDRNPDLSFDRVLAISISKRLVPLSITHKLQGRVGDVWCTMSRQGAKTEMGRIVSRCLAVPERFPNQRDGGGPRQGTGWLPVLRPSARPEIPQARRPTGQ